MDELTEAKNLLIEQKPLVQAYVIDQVRDKMIGNEAALGVIYSGEAIYTQKENPNLEYVIPKEGSNIWIDSWVIPKNAEEIDKFFCIFFMFCIFRDYPGIDPDIGIFLRNHIFKIWILFLCIYCTQKL